MSQGSAVVDPGESILRRIPRIPDYYNPTLPIPILALAFRPNKQDTEGISFYREFFLSVDRLAGSARKPAEFYIVARLKAADLLALGLSLLPIQEEGDLPGHVVVPELRLAAYQDSSKREWVKETNQKLAVLAGRDLITEFQQIDRS
jgi:hypothetical protein